MEELRGIQLTDHSRWAISSAFGLAALGIGAAVAFWLFPVDMLLGRWSWAGAVPGDNAASLIGYMAFAHDQWRWPLFHTTFLNQPGGVNIIFTDPVPLLALLGKITFKLTGFLPLYVGPWILVCYALQSFVGYLVFRQLGLERTQALAAGGLLVLLPSFIFRFPHVGLMAQFAVLLGVLFYLRAVSVSSRREMTLASAGVGGMLFFHPYLLAMTAPVYMAGLAEAAHRGRIRWFEAISLVVLVFAVAIALAFVFGIIGRDPLPKMHGFGHYSLNLLSPVTPQFSAIPIYRESALDMTGGQYEGFNYLGAGVLLLLLYAVVVRYRAVGDLMRRHRFLLATLVGLTLFAASDRIWIGPLSLGNLNYNDFPILDSLTATFRSSGRFFWPVSFVLVFAAVTLAVRHRARALLLILAVLLIQAVDVLPLLERSRDGARVSAKSDFSDWEEAIASHDELVVYPKYLCAAPADGSIILALQLRAARIGRPTSGAYINRGDPPCTESAASYMARIDAAAVMTNPLIVLFKSSYPAILLEGEPARGFLCREKGEAFVCSRNSAALARFGDPLQPVPPIALGTNLTVGRAGTGTPFMVGGWSTTQDDRLWAEGPVTSWAARLPHRSCDEFIFHADVLPLAMGDYAVRNAKAVLNGENVGEIVLSGTGAQKVTLRVPLDGQCIEKFRFELHFDDYRSPRDIGMNADPRPLTWMYTSFAFEAR